MSGGFLGGIFRFLRGTPGGERDRFDDLSPDLADADAKRVAAGLLASLLGRGGQVTSRRRIVGLGRAYVALRPAGRRRFLDIVARDFAVDGASALAAVADLDEFNDWRGFGRRRQVVEAMEPPRRRLLRTFLEIPGGDDLLERMRRDLAQPGPGEDALAELAVDLDLVLNAGR
jgi:malonyl-CoA decarboxylase